MTADPTAQTPQPPTGALGSASVDSGATVTLTEGERADLRFAFIHYHSDYDEGSRAYEVVESIVAARVDAALAPVRELADAIALEIHDQWAAHNRCSDMGDLDGAHVHGNAAEVLEEVQRNLRAALDRQEQGR